MCDRPIESIGIIGGGATGVIIAKALLSEPSKQFKRIRIFERRRELGGVWYYQTNFDDPAPKKKYQKEYSNVGRELKKGNYPSPMYKNLLGNVTYKLYELPQFPAKQPGKRFPVRDEMQQYVLDYADNYGPNIREHVSLQKEVTSCTKKDGRWHVKFRDCGDADDYVNGYHDEWLDEDHFDAIVVATGNYDVPDFPSIEGLQGLIDRYPGMVVHSKFYDTADFVTGQNVLVIGNGPSGLDISREAAECANLPVYRSVRHSSSPEVLTDTRMKETCPVAKFLVDERIAILEDGSRIGPLDRIFLASGYKYSVPMLLDTLCEDGLSMISKGGRIRSLYKHLFFIPDPTLAFGVILRKTIPFPIAQTQGCFIAQVWTGRTKLPSRSEMYLEEQEAVAATGDNLEYHSLGHPKEAGYINGLVDICRKTGWHSPIQPVEWDEDRYKLVEINARWKNEIFKG